jgi:hypothetical protein
MKVVLKSERDKIKLLRESKNLKDLKEGGWDKVFVHQDLTPKQREHRQKLLKQIMERQLSKETNLIIVGDRIVKRGQYTKSHSASLTRKDIGSQAHGDVNLSTNTKELENGQTGGNGQKGNTVQC